MAGRMIHYRCGFNNTTEDFMIDRVIYDESRDGYEIRGKRPQDFLFLTFPHIEVLLTQGEYSKTYTIEYCDCKDTYRIQKG